MHFALTEEQQMIIDTTNFMQLTFQKNLAALASIL